ncbi:hypothetical protein I317_06120 [Kwoniella heveanensis CBS 569]|uniref:Conserved oligomeric Golgi complex subunit 1 n=1 Tax=Kwoniella heveanensis BCC8398 TaxID=1296120 RepID=A0A1B9GL12_9TREE|nr:hypothetical protein I316_06636 [Kwoniella heveanensis BCC8398]OCF40045.1 hypothetical protein I317_06120 [Kwoniella heveanensis CBS 569]
MSTRTTPGPAPYPSLPSYPVPESSRRSTRTSSFAHRPSIPEFNYRHSDRSFVTRGSIAPSVAETSTPTITGYRRRREKDGTSTPGTGGKEDWADLEPDEVFRRLPVNEVKRVEARMRSDALNKQSELRSMVGTRYRDLLTSATQITSLHSSSLRLSDSLREIARSCSNPDINITLDGEGSEAGEEEDVVNMLPVAAHMKLLLDAPEALYSFLAHHAFLNAAFLWLIARVVKEGLSNMPTEQNSAYLPLLQKQWETLLPFRAQIVQRATASLRTKDKLDPKSLSETLLSIILLDNLPISDALSLLLTQRTKAVRDTLQHAESSGPKSSLSPLKTRDRSNSRIQAANASREAAHERENISGVLTDAVHCLLETVVAAKAVFEKRKGKTLDGESMLEEMMRLVQKGETSLSSSQPPPARQNSHQRRASRLASISLPVPRPSPAANRPPVSAAQILQGLPSSQILLRHLPNSITGFTPFITPSSTPTLADRLNEWQKSSIGILQEAVPSWLSALKSVSDIWAVRTSLGRVLVEGDFERAIRNALEDQWGKRVSEVWDEKLKELVALAEKEVKNAEDAIRSVDTNADSFLFSDLVFPSAPAPSFSTTSQGTAFNTFRATVKNRINYRTPSLDNTLEILEDFAKTLRSDMYQLPDNLCKVYKGKAQTTLKEIVRVLEVILDEVGSGKSDAIEAELVVGRIALYLGKSSSFLGDIMSQDDRELEGIQDSLVSVHAKSTRRWRDRSIQEALIHLAPLFEAYRGPQEIRSSWPGEYPTSPSHAIMVSLQSLVASGQKLGIPPTLNLPIVSDALKAFVGSAKGLEGWKSQSSSSVEASAQAALDLGFLVHLSGEKVSSDEVIKRCLDKVSETYPPFGSELDNIIDQSVRRSQLLLYPLLSHLKTAPHTPSLGASRYTPDARNAALLRFGAPSAGVTGGGAGTTEFRSPVVLAKPGKRMGLLSIAA